MKKKIFLFLSLILVIFTASCHSNKELHEFKAPNDFDSTKEYTIDFWAKNDSNIIQRDIYVSSIQKFNEYYPNIHVNLRSYTDYLSIYKDVLQNMSTNTLPNVCISYIDHVATYLTSPNTVVPLSEMIDNQNYGLGGSGLKFESPKKSDLYSKFLEEGYYKNNYYTLPFMRSSEALYINEDYVRYLGYEVPEVLTWDFMFEVAQKAYDLRKQGKSLYHNYTSKEEIEADLAKFFPVIYKSVDNQLITMLKQKGYSYTESDGKVDLFNDNTMEVLDYLADKKQKNLFEIFNVVSYPGNHFNLGNCLFAIDSTAGATWMGSEAPLIETPEDKIVSFKTVVRPIPQFDINNPLMISQGPSVCIFNKDSEQEVVASFIFANFLLTDYVQIKYAETEGYVPVTKKAVESYDYQKYLSYSGSDTYEGFDASISDKELYNATDPKYKENYRKYGVKSYFYSVKIDASKLTINNIDNTFVTAAFNGSTSVRSAAGYLIEKLIKDIRTGKKIDRDYYLNLYNDISSLYKIDMISVSTLDPTSRKKIEFNGIPLESGIMLSLICLLWVGIIVSIIFRRKRKNIS